MPGQYYKAQQAKSYEEIGNKEDNLRIRGEMLIL